MQRKEKKIEKEVFNLIPISSIIRLKYIMKKEARDNEGKCRGFVALKNPYKRVWAEIEQHTELQHWYQLHRVDV